MIRSIDAIIISDARTTELRNMTENSVASLLDSQIQTTGINNNVQNIEYNIFVMESQSEVSYKHTTTVDLSDLDFNYNKFLNIGRKMGSSEFVVISNNDIVYFDEFWSTSIINEMDKDPLLLSACPLEPITQPFVGILPNTGLHYGYQVRKELNGWLILQKRSIYDTIGDLDENFGFWYADNDYGKTLEKHNIKHALVSNAYATHLGSSTLKTISVFDRDYLTNYQARVFRKKWN